ncbi:unnamed protein product [Arabis nemorensis]|uniref:Uncharacterized protein n=1 Tax=Arabis nemorensis TaxID=586526 RepID=A0A565BU84_9BRAS|nr:unnamed protein product [Arabis nemorensis]
MSLGDTRKRRQFVSQVTEKEIIPSSHRRNLAVEEKSEFKTINLMHNFYVSVMVMVVVVVEFPQEIPDFDNGSWNCFPTFLVTNGEYSNTNDERGAQWKAVVVPATEFVEAMTIKKKLREYFSLYQQWILDTINDIISWCGRRMVGMRWNRWIAAIDLSKNYWNLIKTMIANHEDHIRPKTTTNKENSRFIILLARKAYLLKEVVLFSLIRLYVVVLKFG